MCMVFLYVRMCLFVHIFIYKNIKISECMHGSHFHVCCVQLVTYTRAGRVIDEELAVPASKFTSAVDLDMLLNVSGHCIRVYVHTTASVLCCCLCYIFTHTYARVITGHPGVGGWVDACEWGVVWGYNIY